MDKPSPYSPPSDTPPSKGPTEDWEKAAHVKDLFRKARQAKRPLLERWVAEYEILHNRVWQAGRPAWMPSPKVAEIYPTVSAIVAWESDTPPTFDVTAFAEPNSPYHKELTAKGNDLRIALQAAWTINDYGTEIVKVLWDGNVFGTGITKAVWDPQAHSGMGDAILKRVDPFWFYPDPDATSLKDARYVVESYELSDDALEERFPGAGKKVGAGSTEDLDRSPTQTGDSRGGPAKANTSPISPGTSTQFSRPGETRSFGDSQVDSNRHTILECWYLCSCGESAHDEALKASDLLRSQAEKGGLDIEALKVLKKAFSKDVRQDDEPAEGELAGSDSPMEEQGETPPMGAPVPPAGPVQPGPTAATPTDPAADPMAQAFAADMEQSEQGQMPGEPSPEDPSEHFTPTPHWHVTVVSGDVVLMDAPVDKIWSHGQHPYDRFVPVEEGEFWGQSMVELLAPAQKSINWLLAAIEQNIWLAGNPVFVEDNRSGLQRTKITNKPGQRITTNSGSRAEWMNPPQIHPQLAMQLIQFYVGEIERISGLSAIVRGATPTGRNSQGVLDSVQEAAFIRIRMALRGLESMLQSAGQKCGGLITEFYDTPRVVAMVGPAGEETVAALSGKHFYTPDPGADDPTPMRFRLNIQAGSTLSTSRSARIAEADTLFAMGAIDGEAVLAAHDFPGWPTVTARLREVQAAQGTLGQPPSARTAAGRTQ